MPAKQKSRQKKFDTRIDFTPMVDMNMLLITFFMLCTTMIKSQTLQISLPTNEKVDQTEQNKVKQSEAITIILDGTIDDKGRAVDGKVFYYDGMPDVQDANHDGKIDDKEISAYMHVLAFTLQSAKSCVSAMRLLLPRLTN